MGFYHIQFFFMKIIAVEPNPSNSDDRNLANLANSLKTKPGYKSLRYFLTSSFNKYFPKCFQFFSKLS